MAIKQIVHEYCDRCGQKDAEIRDNTVWRNLHKCSKPIPGPQPPPKESRLADVVFVPKGMTDPNGSPPQRRTKMSDDRACETPLVDLLRIPVDARLEYEHNPTSHSMIPVGILCNRAADRIVDLERRLANARQAGMEEAARICEQQCQSCHGDGYTVEPVCCGRRDKYGDCCGSPEPEQTQCITNNHEIAAAIRAAAKQQNASGQANHGAVSSQEDSGPAPLAPIDEALVEETVHRVGVVWASSTAAKIAEWAIREYLKRREGK